MDTHIDRESAAADPDALYRHSIDEVRRGAFTRAAELMRAAIDRAPERALFHCSLARIACQLDDYAGAAEAFDNALDVAAEHMNERDHYDHGAILAALGHHERAEAAYRRALVLAPEWPLLLDNLGVSLHHLQRLDAAEDAFRRALAAHPPAERAFTLRNLASLLIQLDRHEEATACYQQALEHAPAEPQTHHDLAALLHARGDLKRAEQHYRQAIALAPEWPDPVRHLADLLVAADRAQEAETLYRLVLARHPDDPDILNGLGTCLNALEQLDAAIDILERTIAVAPHEALYHYNLGVVLERAQRTEPALDAYRSAVALDPAMTDAHGCLGSALYRLGHLDEARAVYQTVIELAPDDPVARHLLAALTGQTSAGAPPAYVARVFDDYSERYDEHMRDELGYRAPELLRDLVVRVMGESARDLALLDLGCGTGMMGEALRSHTRVAHGVDLSPGMLDRARRRGCYQQLYQGDVVEVLADSSLGQPTYDAIVAADVLVYIGDLGPLMSAARARLSAGGALVFSVEEHPGDGFVLRETGRYAHSRAYIEETARACGLAIAAAHNGHVRNERGAPVQGLLCAFRASE